MSQKTVQRNFILNIYNFILNMCLYTFFIFMKINKEREREREREKSFIFTLLNYTKKK